MFEFVLMPCPRGSACVFATRCPQAGMTSEACSVPRLQQGAHPHWPTPRVCWFSTCSVQWFWFSRHFMWSAFALFPDISGNSDFLDLKLASICFYDLNLNVSRLFWYVLICLLSWHLRHETEACISSLLLGPDACLAMIRSRLAAIWWGSLSFNMFEILENSISGWWWYMVIF